MLFFIFMLIVAIGAVMMVCYDNSRINNNSEYKLSVFGNVCSLVKKRNHHYSNNSEKPHSKNDNFKIDCWVDSGNVKSFIYLRKTKNGKWVPFSELKNGTRYKDKNGKWDFINLKNMSEDEIKYALVNMTEGVKKIRSIEDYNLLPLKTEIIKEKQKSDLEEWDERFNERIQTKEI